MDLLYQVIAIAIPVIYAITVHEVAHGLIAKFWRLYCLKTGSSDAQSHRSHRYDRHSYIASSISLSRWFGIWMGKAGAS